MRRKIILRAEQVRALRAGATQVRVPVKLPKWASTLFHWRNERLEVMRNYGLEPPVWEPVPCPYAPGDVLRVREPWIPFDGDVFYMANNTDGSYPASFRWRSAATMPAWAARMWLTVESVQAERDGDGWAWVLTVRPCSTERLSQRNDAPIVNAAEPKP